MARGVSILMNVWKHFLANLASYAGICGVRTCASVAMDTIMTRRQVNKITTQTFQNIKQCFSLKAIVWIETSARWVIARTGKSAQTQSVHLFASVNLA